MANINKIKLSGTTYNIQDLSAAKSVELTQAQYDALVSGGTVDPNTFYIITDAQGADLSQYYTSAQTESAITAAVSGKQETLVSGTNIKTINNESLLGSGNITIQGGGGGKAISAGTNISITTGETADTINCTLPMKAEVNNTSIYFGTDNWGSASGGRNLRIGYNANALGDDAICLATNSTTNGTSSSIVGGRNNYIYKAYSFIGGGYYTKLYNMYEVSVGGQFNNSVSASTTFGNSGNTLFSVGNGTADNARHNAFEIRQNGDIYITSGGTDIKLQDNLGGGGSSYTAGTGIDITNDVISVSGVVMSSAVTSAVTSGSTDVVTSGGVYDQLGGMKIVKLTESEYTALVTKDDDTLYVVVPDPSN